MKNSFNFFSIVGVLLLASTIVLTGGIFAIVTDTGEAKAYDMENRISADSNIIAGDDIPTSQTELQKKFSAMYDISEDGKTITVISEDYLNNYWKSNYEKEVIRSFTTEEVYYIIQDSIRLYNEYEKVVLLGFEPISSDEHISVRFPRVNGQTICANSDRSSLNQREVQSDIHAIIMYRLKALSSPNAFFSGADAIIFAGNDPVAYNSMLPEALFYIPGYSANTDRDYILTVIGGTTGFTDLDRFTDLFMVSLAGEAMIEFSSVANGAFFNVFPTDEMVNFDWNSLDSSTTN